MCVPCHVVPEEPDFLVTSGLHLRSKTETHTQRERERGRWSTGQSIDFPIISKLLSPSFWKSDVSGRMGGRGSAGQDTSVCDSYSATHLQVPEGETEGGQLAEDAVRRLRSRALGKFLLRVETLDVVQANHSVKLVDELPIPIPKS